MKTMLSALCFFCGSMFAADNIQTKTTYAKAYGESKGNPTVDPAKDLPRYPAVEPKDAAATWKVKKGFKMELAAHEPQVRSPIAISFDERGRMFVCEMIDYSEMRDVTPHLGRISMLEDKDGDGFYETSTVFADNLAWPTGLICANGGVYVIATPEVIFFKDTKGAGKADVRETVFTGFGTGLKILNVQGLANCPQWGQDNRIHIQAGGGNRGVVTCVKRPDLKGVELGGRDFWFDPRTYEFGLEAGGAQFGMSFDNYGRKFACSNSDHLQFFVYDDRYASRNPYFTMPPSRQSIAADGGAAEVFRISPDEPWRIVRTRWRVAGVVKGMVEGGGRVSGYFTGATGTTIYRGDAYGDDFVNNSFTGDAGGQLVHRKKIYPDGVSLIGKRPDDEQHFEFAASNDTWVRVVNFANAPDGCLYVCDMYREVIEHPWSIPDEIKKHLDLNSGNDRGRIWRIAPDSGPPSPLGGDRATQRAASAIWKRRASVDLGKASTAELVDTLSHPNGWHRDTASRLLYEKQDEAAVPLLEKVVSESSNPLAKIHALTVLDGLSSVTSAGLLHALGDKNEHVRERGLALIDHVAVHGEIADSLWLQVEKLSADPSPRVRFQLALSAGLLQGREPPDSNLVQRGIKSHDLREDYILSLLKQVLGDGADRWVNAAVLSGPPDRACPILENECLLKSMGSHRRPGPVTEDLVRIIAARNERDEVNRLLFMLTDGSGNSRPSWFVALAEGLKRAGTTIAKVDTEHKLAAVFTKAASTAQDPKADESKRLEAISLVALDTPKTAVPVLRACLEKSQPQVVQTASVSALGHFSGKEVTEAFIEHLPHLTGKARAAAIDELLKRPERALALLQKVEGTSSPLPRDDKARDAPSALLKASELGASQVQALLNHKDKAVAALADKVLADLKPPTRESVIAKFQPALTTKGDAARGQIVFTQRCMACHKAGTQGLQVGPDLVTVKTKGREGIFTAILDPNKEVAPQYIAYTVNTKDGQTLAGIVTNDSANSMTLKMMGGAELNILRSNIKGSSSSGGSLMPEGIESGMSIQDMADLLEFIEGLN
jgi:putative membrane-bound dehydrogenase-like protein